VFALKYIIRLILSALLLAGVLSASLSVRPANLPDTLAEVQDNRKTESNTPGVQVQLQEGYYQSPVQFAPVFPLDADTKPAFDFNFSAAKATVHLTEGFFYRAVPRSFNGLLSSIQTNAP
jgi:hypothetical protein